MVPWKLPQGSGRQEVLIIRELSCISGCKSHRSKLQQERRKSQAAYVVLTVIHGDSVTVVCHARPAQFECDVLRVASHSKQKASRRICHRTSSLSRKLKAMARAATRSQMPTQASQSQTQRNSRSQRGNRSRADSEEEDDGQDHNIEVDNGDMDVAEGASGSDGVRIGTRGED